MKKFITLWFIFMFILGCSFKEEHKKDILENSYQVTNENIQKYDIEKDLNYFLKKYNRNWSKQNRDKFIEVIYKGSTEFNIDPKIVMSIISIESQYRIVVKGKNKNSVDFGLCQQNSRYINQRYKATEEYLKRNKIAYTNSKYDIGKNVFACYMYLKDISDSEALLHFRDYITAYNQGIKGALRNNNDTYYQKFMSEFMEL
jgi:hypothetical protein